MEQVLKFNEIKISSEVRSKIPEEAFLLLSSMGVPRQVASLPYDVFDDPIIQDNRLILGRTHGEESFNYLFLDLADLAVKHQWNYPGDERTVFINSGLRELYFTVIVIQEIINNMIDEESFGDYHNNHEKYAALFKNILVKNDSKAFESAGMWYWYIEEMELGVI